MSAIAVLMRHGQAVLGSSKDDRPLTDLGREQAVAAGRWLAPLGLGRAYATATPRARETAALAAPSLTVGPASGMEGLRIGVDETPLRGVAALGGPFADPAARPAGGESLLDLQQRSGAAFDRIVGADPAPALVVAHRFVDCVLIAAGLGVPLRKAEALLQDPGAVNVWSAEEDSRLLAVNIAPLDPMRTGGADLLLPDTDTPVERRRYLLATNSRNPKGLRSVRGAADRVYGVEVIVEVLAPAEVAAAVVEAAGLGKPDVARIPTPPGSIAILDRAQGRWWVRGLGWTPRPRKQA